ncbi:MAG: hypothetical protein H0X66_08910 [Verrucomicrobia bacterium]|nr:hypothetical protein [Verrucomicrobiota bacterium]
MKFFLWAIVFGGLLTVPTIESRGAAEAPAAETPSQLSPGTLEIIKLLNAGVEQDVLLGFIGNATNLFDLSADDLIYLQSEGVPSEVTTAMLQRDHALRQTSVTNQVAVALQGAPAALANQPAMSPAAINDSEPAVTQFYQALAPYGTWFQLPEWGWAWQPREAATNSEWRPYVDGGRWAWTDHGWYWASDYPWGWAAFHYGRWLQMEKLGWVWFPDTVWAPSWVTWRHHDDYMGWAPLPPNALADRHLVEQPLVSNYDFGLSQHSYTFVNVRYIFVHNVRSHRLPPAKVKDFYRHCKVVNDFAPGRNRSVANRGIPIDRVSAATGRHLTPVPIFKGGVDLEGDASRRSTAFTPVQPFVLAPHSRTRSPSPSFNLPAAPRTHAPPVTPAPQGSYSRSSRTTPESAVSPMTPVVPMTQNPVASPMNPIVPPMNPIVPMNRGRTENPVKPFSSVAPVQVATPSAPANPGYADRRHAERRDVSQHRVSPAVPTAPATPPAQPAPALKAWRAVGPNQEIPVPQEQQERQQRRSRN